MTRNHHEPGYRHDPITAYKWLETQLEGPKTFSSPIKYHRWNVGWNGTDDRVKSQPSYPELGFYSFKTIDLAINNNRELFFDFLVLVRISICGDIVEHHRGYRSEYAKVDQIVGWGDRVSGWTILDLKKAYNLPVAPRNAVSGKKAQLLGGLIRLWK